MKLTPLDESYSSDGAARETWTALDPIFRNLDGVAFYKNPVVGSGGSRSVPDFTILARGYQPIAIKVLNVGISEISHVSEDDWVIRGKEISSPIAELDDFEFGIQSVLGKRREIRSVFNPISFLRLSLIGEGEFSSKFPGVDTRRIWFRNSGIDTLLNGASIEIDENTWRLALSLIQGLDILNGRRPSKASTAPIENHGQAIEVLKNRIALFDQEQLPAAMQIPKGPQRIRGLAGTGKTVVLAMKAATIHAHEPNAKILFTFNTQSLYNQVTELITEFYRMYGNQDPNWDNLHVQHGWGGRTKPGVYYNLCRRFDVPAVSLKQGQSQDYKIPFRACCVHALSLPLAPEYDYVLVDEAQDFPSEFFQVIFKLTSSPHKIYWAYDEFQTLSDIVVPSPEMLFGSNTDGTPRVSLDQGEQDGLVERDIVLKKSYRCPREILMTAHAVGLGLHRRDGPIQMIADVDSWRSLGYDVEGNLRAGDTVTISRPEENSPNPISRLFPQARLIEVSSFRTDNEELEAVADAIEKDISIRKINPKDILVISLDHRKVKVQMSMLSRLLLERKVKSIVPGLIDDADAFGIEDHITLSTVYRAKGNEAFLVYILSFDSTYDYVEELAARNRAFVSISRAKGWVRISGCGDRMAAANIELQRIQASLPRLQFTFPDVSKMKQLDVETTRRKRQQSRFKEVIKQLRNVDTEILKSGKAEIQGILAGIDDVGEDDDQ